MSAARAAVGSPMLRRILEAAGYRVEDVGNACVAVRSADHRAVVLAPRARGPAELERLFPSSAVHRTIVYDEEPGDAARALAAERGLELLDPAALGPALGELLLPSPLLAGWGFVPSGTDDALESPFPPVQAHTQVIRPRIGRREAQALAGLDAARYSLRFVPFYVASYRVRPVSPGGGSGPVYRRLVAVNAVSRRGEIWEEGTRELVPDTDGASDRLPAQLGEAAASAVAVETIRREHTVRVDHIEQHAGALVVESRRVPPPPDAVRLGPLSLVFVPFWYAESTGGRRVLERGQRPLGGQRRARERLTHAPRAPPVI